MSLSPEMNEWLEQKANIGYSKGAVIRMILAEYMKLEKKEKWPMAERSDNDGKTK